MKHLIAIAALALPISLISSCANPRVDLARMESIGVKSDETKYRQEARRFIKLAQVGDLNGLIRLTSPLTLSSQGRQKIVENYVNELIPTFRNSRVEWHSGGTIIYDLNYNVGLEFSGVVHGSKPSPFYVSLFKEDGKIVIANIRRTPKPTKVKD